MFILFSWACNFSIIDGLWGFVLQEYFKATHPFGDVNLIKTRSYPNPAICEASPKPESAGKNQVPWLSLLYAGPCTPAA